MNQKIEILAPGGDINAMKTAILAGADAIYCGLDKFNARNRAANISFDDLQGILRIAHQHECKVFLTLNIIILDSETTALIKLLNRLVNTAIDGVIVQDFGLIYLLNQYFPTLKIHASTQLTSHNEGQIKFLHKMNVERVNLSRELNLSEIKHLTAVAHDLDMMTEVFVHGSYCISFSGLCYMSSVQSGNSGNRGQCSQPCRDRYVKTAAGKEYPLNLKDNSAYFDFKELYEIGVDSLKIEGRIKESEYVYTIVKAWRQQVDTFINKGALSLDNSELYKVFNRDFSDGFLKNKVSKEMFINNPMNHAITYLKEQNHKLPTLEQERKEQELLDEKEELKTYLRKETARYDTTKQPLSLEVSGKDGKPLLISISTADKHFEITSQVPLSDSGKEMLSEAVLLKRLKAIDDTPFFIKDITVELEGQLYIPFKELTALKKRLLYTLNNGRHFIAPVTLAKAKRQGLATQTPQLSVVISDISDVEIVHDGKSQVFFQLPNSFVNEVEKYAALFEANKHLTPWFPSVLIGKDYRAAVDLLEHLQGRSIVTNNTGIALEAYERGIPWIAGPQLNISNSYSLLSLKENLDCRGAFISNELGKKQMIGIKSPEDFLLYYTIYQPIMLMISRQCFFHQVSGCNKFLIDDTCITQCEKVERITNHKGQDFIIEKSKGNYHRIFNDTHQLNTEIVSELGNRFHSLCIDLSDVKDKTVVDADKGDLIQLFRQHLKADDKATARLHALLSPSNNVQYLRGI